MCTSAVDLEQIQKAIQKTKFAGNRSGFALCRHRPKQVLERRETKQGVRDVRAAGSKQFSLIAGDFAISG